MPNAVWTNDYLDKMRSVGDPPADSLIEEIFSGGRTAVDAINLLLRDLVENDDVPAPSLPRNVHAFFSGDPLPAWADKERMEAGAALFRRYGKLLVMILNLYSLPVCYAAKKGAQVLVRTERMHSNTRRRIVETSQAIIDFMAPGGLSTEDGGSGAGIRSAQKVRLMHAAIRHFLRRDPTFLPEYGTPINQEDLAGTLMAFSVVSIDGLTRLGVDLEASEVDAFIHVWNVVGHIMGLERELLPEGYDAAHALSEAISRRQFAPSPEGQHLTRELIAMAEYILPGDSLDGIPSALIRYFVGDDVADMLAVPVKGDIGTFLPRLRYFAALTDKMGDSSYIARKLAEITGHAMVSGLLLTNRGPSRVPFHIPTELRQEWGVNWV